MPTGSDAHQRRSGLGDLLYDEEARGLESFRCPPRQGLSDLGRHRDSRQQPHANDTVDTSRKRSRLGSAAAVVAAHGLIIYLMMAIGLTHPKSSALVVSPIVVSLIRQSREPPLSKPARLSRPKLAMLQITFAEPIPEFHVPAPRVSVPSAGPIARRIGSPARRGNTGQVGGPLALRVIHYVAPSLPFGTDEGNVLLALHVSPNWGVDRVRILHSTGAWPLDRAAIRAVRQWTFAPVRGLAPGKSIWATVVIRFAPPQPLLRVPFLIMPYSALPREVVRDLGSSRERQPPSPPAAVSVRHLLDKLIAAFPGASGLIRTPNSQSTGHSLETLASLGPIRSVNFLGHVRHGIAGDAGRLLPDETTHWEAYEIEQTHGASVWLVSVTKDGAIRRIEVAIE